MNISYDRVKLTDSKATQINHTFDRSIKRQNSVDILYKGLKRKISQRSYSKIKKSFKIKPQQNRISTQPLVSSSVNRQKLKLQTAINKVVDPQVAHEQLLKLKQSNHYLFQQNTELLRKIRKQQKIQEIYKKKIQGRQLYEMDFNKILQIKLLLQVQALQNIFQEKQSIYQQKVKYVKSKKHSFKDDWILKKAEIYQLLIQNQEQLTKLQKQKNTLMIQKTDKLQNLIEKINKLRAKKNQKMNLLNEVKRQIKQLNDKFKAVQAQNKKNKTGGDMMGLTTIMSSLMTNNNKSSNGSNKQNSSTILKNNMSSISVKNRNNIQQLEKQIEKIKEQSQLINNEIQQFMDSKIKQKLLIHKQINSIEQNQRKQRQIQNRNNMCKNNINRNNSKSTTQNPLKCSIVGSSSDQDDD